MENSNQKRRGLITTSKKEEEDSPIVEIDSNLHYFSEYKKIHELAVSLSQQLAATRERQESLLTHIGQLAVRSEEFRDPIRPSPPEKKKKPRRAADEIHKEHVCPAVACDRRYGSLASLRIHLKSKHPHLYEVKKRGRGPTE